MLLVLIAAEFCPWESELLLLKRIEGVSSFEKIPPPCYYYYEAVFSEAAAAALGPPPN